MREKIFLSYASKDRAIADRVGEYLRRLNVVDADVEILDPQKDLHTGDNVREMLKKKMMAANRVVIITSPDTDHSQWVNYEAGLASALEKPIIALVIGQSSKQSQLLRSLHDVQTFELKEMGQEG